jgi:hypothetical protein
LKAAGVGLSAEAALQSLHNVQVVDIQVGSGRKRGVTTGRQRTRQVLAALGISNLSAPAGLETT